MSLIERKVRGIPNVYERVRVEDGRERVVSRYIVFDHHGKPVKMTAPLTKNGSVPAPKTVSNWGNEIMAEARSVGPSWRPPRKRKPAPSATRTLGDLVAEFMKRRHPDEDSNSHDYYRRRLAHALNFLGKDTPLSEITRDDCARYAAELKRRVADKKSAASTAKHNLRSLQTVMNAAVEWEWLPRSPARSLKPVKVPESIPRVLSGDEWKALKKASRGLCGDYGFSEVFVFLGVYTMIRSGNLRDLLWSHVDLKRNLILVPGEMTKSRKVISLPIADPLREVLERTPRRGKSGHVLVHQYGLRSYRGVSVTVQRKWWAKLLKASGVSNFTPHNLRDCGASWALRAGAPLALVSDLLQHSTEAVTKKYAAYAHPQRERAIQLLGDYEPD